MKRFIISLLLVLIISLSNLISVQAKPSSRSEFLIASVDTNITSYFTEFPTDRLRFIFEIVDGPVTTVGTIAYDMWFDITAADEGKTFWWSQGDINFDVFTGFLTNGQPNLVNVYLQNYYGGQANGIGYQLESQFFDNQVGPNGIDLSGFTIYRIGVRFNHIQICPSGLCAEANSTLLFTQEATKQACQNGYWQYLKRMDGSTFKNIGACIKYVNTGQ